MKGITDLCNDHHNSDVDPVNHARPLFGLLVSTAR